MSKNKPTILILGKIPPPLMGPAIATQIILKSSLLNNFNLVHFDTRINKEIASMGKWNFTKFIKSITIYFKFLQTIKQYQPALILVPISQTTLGFFKDAPFIWLGKWKNKKILIQLRGSNLKNWLKTVSNITNNMVKTTLKKCVGVIVLGNNLKYLFEDYFNDNQIFVVPNGANYDLQSPKNKEFTVLYLANFLPSKSFDDVLKAVVILKEKGVTNFKLQAAGAWGNENFKQQCLSIIKNNNLQNVTILPPQTGKNKMQLFANAKVFIFCPKMPEGHPWVIVEAMANGLPIISTNQGAIIESVKDNENGFIVPAESPNSIAEKLKILIENENLRKQFAVKSKQNYTLNFTEEKMVENLKTVFNTILATPLK